MLLTVVAVNIYRCKIERVFGFFAEIFLRGDIPLKQLAVALIIVFNSNTMTDMIFLAVLLNMLIYLMDFLGQYDPRMIELYTRV